METFFANTKERILHYTDIKGFTKENFFKELGVTYGNFKGKAKEKALSVDVLAKIVSKYPELNPEWLLTGKGEMLKKPNVQNNTNTPINSDVSSVQDTKCKQQIQILQQENTFLKENNNQLKENITLLKSIIQNKEQIIALKDKEISELQKKQEYTPK